MPRLYTAIITGTRHLVKNNKMKHEGQKSFPNIAMRFIQGFLAIMPIIKGYDKILYTGAAIALLLFISSIIMTVLIFREKKWNTLSYLYGNRIGNIADIIISIIGMIVCKCMGYNSFFYYWCICLGLSIIAVAYSKNRK